MSKDSKGTNPADAASAVSRRKLLLGAAGALAAASSGRLFAQAQPGVDRPLRERVLLRGGTVLTLDGQIADLARGDVLIEGSRIAAVAGRIEVSTTTTDVIDAVGTVVMPGFVDTHRHMWQGALRNILPDGVLADYGRDITGAARAVFRPEDARIGNLVSALGALNAGVTSILDWSHIGNSPEHSDAAIQGLRESGIRGTYAFGGGTPGPRNRFPDDIRRLRREHFSSADQLLTLAMAAGTNPADWSIAREVGAAISIHVVGSLGAVTRQVMGPDVTYIHCTGLPSAAWEAIEASGGHVSIAGPIEMQMNHGVPPVQEALDHGIRPSLSVDVETQQPGDMFTQMRGAMANRLDSRIGSLTPGKQADIIMLRADAINVLPLNNAYGSVVLGMDTSNVDTVFVGGQLRKRGGQLTGVDLAGLRRDVGRSREHLLAQAGWPDTVLGGYLPGH